MSSSIDVYTPREFELNRLHLFLPKRAEGEEGDPKPSGPFEVLGDYEIPKEGKDVERFLLLRPPKESKLLGRFAIEYPNGLISANFVTFALRGRVWQIRAELSEAKPGSFSMCQLRLVDRFFPVTKYVVYERQVEGTWIPTEADGDELRP
jgi:hypothetical protein